jgi:hypothetical protein
MADSILQAELVQDSGDFKHLTEVQTPQGRALLVSVGGGILLAAGAKSGSGTIVGAAVATFGYAADVPNALAAGPIQYPRGGATAQVQLSLFLTANTFVVTATTFTIVRNGVATASTIVVPAAVVGAQTLLFAEAFAAGNRFDLRVDNPGNAADVGAIIAFGYSADFF